MWPKEVPKNPKGTKWHQRIPNCPGQNIYYYIDEDVKDIKDKYPDLDEAGVVAKLEEAKKEAGADELAELDLDVKSKS